MKYTLFAVVASAVTFVSFAPLALASTLVFAPTTEAVHPGETFTVKVYANAPTAPDYTVKMSINYTPTTMQLSSWSYDPAWNPVRQPGYDGFDNVSGSLVRTAGYPNGFSGKVLFGTATFVAAAAGSGKITVAEDSALYDADTTNVYTGGNEVAVTVVGAAKPAPTPTPTPAPVVKAAPVSHHYGVSMTIAKTTIAPSESIPVALELTGVGSTTSAPIPLEFQLLNTNGEVVFKEAVTMPVGTASSATHVLDLSQKIVPAGDYTVTVDIVDPLLAAPARARAQITVAAPVVTAPAPTTTPGISPVELILILILLVLMVLLGFVVYWHYGKKRHAPAAAPARRTREKVVHPKVEEGS